MIAQERADVETGGRTACSGFSEMRAWRRGGLAGEPGASLASNLSVCWARFARQFIRLGHWCVPVGCTTVIDKRYLKRRGHTWFVRVSVPADLRAKLRKSEYVRSLQTQVSFPKKSLCRKAETKLRSCHENAEKRKNTGKGANRSRDHRPCTAKAFLIARNWRCSP